jgi:cytochrome c553
MRKLQWAAMLMGALVATPALAADKGGDATAKADIEAGKQLVQKGNPDNPMVMACQSCHGQKGKGNPTAKFPRLAGQNVEYMVKQLKNFADGSRANYPTMTNIAKGMSEQDMINVGAYYNQQEVSVSAPDASENLLAMGERIANNGLGEKNVPACTSCHGPKGQGVPPVFPALAGQHASYIVKQLQDWEAGSRKNDPAQMMSDIAPKLSDQQRKAVAAYFKKVGAGS